MTISVSDTANNRNTTLTTKQRTRKAFSRSPYREKTVMMRVPESMVESVRKQLDQLRLKVQQGRHDH